MTIPIDYIIPYLPQTDNTGVYILELLIVILSWFLFWVGMIVIVVVIVLITPAVIFHTLKTMIYLIKKEMNK